MPAPRAEHASTTDTATVAGGAVLRAYRQGLGDCFLLTFPGQDRRGSDASGQRSQRPFTLLIDCGLFYRYPDQSERMRQVAEDLATTSGGIIDALVLTHEHFDHLAAFRWRESLAILRERIRFGELWLAWTEDPGDALANALRAEIGSSLAALRAVMPKLDLLDFSTSTNAARSNALALFERDQIRYLSPGESFLPFEGGTAPRVFVLGPPKDRALLRVNVRDDALYLAASGTEQAILSALLARSGQAEQDQHQPFGKRVGLTLEQAAAEPFLQEHYHGAIAGDGAATGDPKDSTGVDDNAWRRIDDLIEDAGTGLALQYDNYVNNTSLVLAFELPNQRGVLLFPGDAQTGNWLSWADDAADALTFALADRQVRAIDLIERTVLYKVGHHGSHNATLRSKGLERMRSGELVAVIPTDEAWAWTSRGKGWRFPYLPLYQRLVEKTRGRVLQTDVGLPDRKPRLGQHPVASKGLPYTDTQWQGLQRTIADCQGAIDRFRQRLTETDLYFEWTIDDPE